MNTTGTRITLLDLNEVDFAKGDGLLPVVVQHPDSRAVLMLGYMNRAALLATLTRRRVVFFSRSKGRLWEKGETSGHFLELVQVQTDCDRDALLVSARPCGPVCHTGSGSCFGEVPETPDDPLVFLVRLEEVISARIAMRPEGSYTAKLLAAGGARIAQKVGEEGLEVALAGAGGNNHEVIKEVSDLLYHVMVMLKARGLSFADVVTELRARHHVRGPLSPTSGLS